MIFRDLGLIEYKEAWDYQEKLFGEAQEEKKAGRKPENHLLFCEHHPVFTLGKSGAGQNLLINEEMLREKGIGFYRNNRGGDITFHGPGQIVGYPILDLESLGLGLKDYIVHLENGIIELLGRYGLKASHMEGATGVWLDADHAVKARKICAIGVKSGRYITMHGLALNVNTNLDYFTYINPCGFETRGVTSMEKELGHSMNIEEIKDALKTILLERFSSPAFPKGS
mgnify:CR=1 FL=1